MFTVFGSSGYIGSHLVRYLATAGEEVATPMRGAPIGAAQLGHVVYAIGLTADFRTRPFDTMEAHVTRLAEILQTGGFDSFLYLSSTRVYGGASQGREDAAITVNPASPSDLYNISKLAGEALCLGHDNSAVRVARLSNVFGGDLDARTASDNFLDTVACNAVSRGRVELGTAMASEKDYVSVNDVVRAIRRIAISGEHRLYNVASGANVANTQIMAELKRLTGCTVDVTFSAPVHGFPAIDIGRLSVTFAAAGEDWAPRSVVSCLSDIVNQLKAQSPLISGERA